MLGVLTDSPSDSDLLNFQSDYAMTYPVVRSSSDILLSFHYPQALPTTFVFDRGGHQVGSPQRRRDLRERARADARQARRAEVR